ncbi:MAG: RNA polymerase factor sigma-54 [Clostridium sp.]
MNLGFDLKLSQEQKLVMTMEMQQSIKLLQMSSYELLQHIDKELQENVVLETENAVVDTKEYSVDNELKEYREIVKYLEFDNFNSRVYSQDDENEAISPFNFISDKPTLKDYLSDQLMYSGLNKEDEKVCRYIVDNIDHKGYLETTIIEDLVNEFGIGEHMAIECLLIVQNLEPVGIGARSLSECLIIQLNKKNVKDSVLEEIINTYLVELSKSKYQFIGKALGISAKAVQEYEDVIKKLEPKPTRGFFTGEEISYVIPDVYIKKLDDNYIVVMNDSLLPKLVINNTYKEVINSGEDQVAVNYVKDKISSAMFLIKSIQSRKNTLCRVVEEIVKNQKEYFDGGDDFIKPMTIKSIAYSLDMHESTVSRAIRDKYVALSSGEVRSIKSLFTTYVNVSNEELSSVNVKDMIKKVVSEEVKTKPLSDLSICNILNEKGIDISRRTVAKYREEIGIKSSSQRKRLI